MGRTSASLKIVGGASSRREHRGDPNVVPWKEMERRVAERLAAKAARGSGRSDLPPWKKTASGALDSFTSPYVDSAETEERAPDSGVRASEPGLAAARPLTFTVYSVEELDARQRFSAPPPSVPPPPPSRWPDVWRGATSLMRVWWGWYRTPKPRSRMADVCGVAAATLKADLLAALKQLPWRKIVVGGAIGVASFLFLLFVVLTAAELTDDLKPGAPRQLGTRVETTQRLESSRVEAPAAASAEPPATIELEDPAAPPAKKAPAPPVKKPVTSKKKTTDRPGSKKGADVFNP